MRGRIVAAALAAALASAAGAQDRPSEDELFGAPLPKAEQQPEGKPAPAAGKPGPEQGGASGPHGETEAELFGSKSSPTAPPPPAGALIPKDREDWLKIGGLLQLRANLSAYEDVKPSDWPLSSPNLLDVYLDTRPNDRVRGFVLGRMAYDPTIATSGGGTVSGGTAGTGASINFGTTSTTSNPGAVLDQLWINFDLYHRAFVTAGRQHVKWGVGKFWNPTDYLHAVRRDPLATFDARTGTTLVKLHVPWEQRGWNLYGIGLLEDLGGDTTRTATRLGRLGGGGRAEIVLGSAELGLDAMVQDGHHPRYGVDLSAGIWDFDVYSEVALRTGGDGPHWIRTGPGPLDWTADTRERLTPQAVVGGTFAFKYSDQDSASVGVEYFYNDLGYDEPSVYPFLLAGAPLRTGQTTFVQQDPRAFQPFYLGRHYAAVNLYLPQPGSWNDTTVILSGIGNLSDRSYVARLDVSVLALTYLTVETFVAGHFGKKGGEFRFALPAEVSGAAAQAGAGSSFPSGAPVVDVGIALKLAL